MNIAAVSLQTLCLTSCAYGAGTPAGKRSRAPSTSPSVTPTVVNQSKEPEIKSQAEAVKEKVRDAERKSKTGVRLKYKSSSFQSQLKLVLDRVGQLGKRFRDGPPAHKPTIHDNAKSPFRDRSLIIVNAAESTNATPDERIVNDEKFLQRMIALLFDEGEHGINSFRIGKKQEDSSKARPLKIVRQNSDEARHILR